MLARFTTHNAAHGSLFRVSGKSKTDKYIFTRIPTRAHLHQMIVSGADEIAKVIDDLDLHPRCSDIQIHIALEVEPGDRSADALTQEIEEQFKKATAKIEELREQLEQANAKLQEPQAELTGGRITDEQIALLNERDEMLELLIPLVETEEDSPLDVLRRVIERANTAPEEDAEQKGPAVRESRAARAARKAEAAKANARGDLETTVVQDVPPATE